MSGDTALGSSKPSIDFLLDVINLIPSPIYIKDDQHRWVEFNQAFCEFMGLSRSELLGKSDYDISPSDQADIYWEMDNEVFKSRQRISNLEKNDGISGKERWVESVKSYYEDPHGNPFIIGLITDVTDLKLREQELAIAEQKAKLASKAKSEFLANMSHEIRTPMNGILGMAQVLVGTSHSEDQAEIISIIERSGNALLKIINDILNFSKLEAGQFQICPEPFNLRDVVEDVIALLGPSANEKNIELVLDFNPRELQSVIGDAGRIRQILFNLIGNGIKFTSQGHVLLKVTEAVKADQLSVTFQVKDSGIGIPQDKLGSIFNEFEQVDGSTTRKFGGTGLGLAISKKLVELMEGKLSVNSVLEQGSEFTFTIPFNVTDRIDTAENNNSDISLAGKHALIVDDIDDNLRILSVILNKLSISVDTANSAVQAARQIRNSLKINKPYDIIITDYLMPEIDGLQLVSKLSSYPNLKNIPILVVSSVDKADCKEQFLAAGATDVLVKPIKSSTLSHNIKKILSQGLKQNDARHAHLPGRITSAQPQKPSMEKRILVAEDNDVNALVIQRMLDPYNFHIDIAPNGLEAVKLFSQHIYELVLMDISMPVLDGLGALEKIRNFEQRKTRPKTPVIAVSAHVLDSQKKGFFEAGMDDFLPKPIQKHSLDEIIDKWSSQETVKLKQG